MHTQNPNHRTDTTHKEKDPEATSPSARFVQATKQAGNMTENRNVTLWLDGCIRKDEYSQMALYRHYYSYGMGICLRYARGRESALEMLNDGFLKVFLKIEQYNREKPFKPWLRKILVHAAIDHYRKYDQGRQLEEELSSFESRSSAYNEALDQLGFEDLLQVMQLLTPAYRMVFNLYVVEGLSHKDIAEQLDISVGSSKSNLAKAREKIKALLRQSHDIYFKSKKYG